MVRTIFFIIALLLPVAAASFARDGATRVDRILVQGQVSSATDAAVRIPASTSRQDVVRQGMELKSGDRIRIYFPGVRVQVSSPAGDLFLLECTECDEDSPMEFQLGQGDGPHVQRGGDGTYQVAPRAPGDAFNVILEVILGPETRQVPVGVKGTVFRLAAWRDQGYMVNLVEGKVTSGAADGSLELTPGQTLALARPQEICSGDFAALSLCEGTGEARVIRSTPVSIRDRIISRLDRPLSALPPDVTAPPASAVETLGPWVTMGAGALIAATGGVVRYLAISERDDSRARAQQLYQTQACTLGHEAADAAARAYYDQAYSDKVAPRDTAAWFLMGAGAAAATAGLVWLLVQELPPEVPMAGLSPLPDGQGLSLQLDWRF